MYAKASFSILIALTAAAAWAAPLRVDLSQSGAVEPGWLDWSTGTRLDNANVERRFQNAADFDDDFTIRFTKVDSRNRGQMSDAIPLHDMLEDAFKESNPFTMTFVDLAPGQYVMTTYSHDTNEDVVNDDGTLNLTVKDADGTRLVADHLQQSWGPNPAFVASATFTFRSDGSDVVLTFEDNNDGIHNEAYLNGFELDRAVEPTKASAPQPADGTTDVPRDVVLHWAPADTVAAVNGHKVFFSNNLDDAKNGAAAAGRGIVTPPEFDTKALPFTLEYGTTYYWRVDEGSNTTGWSDGKVWSFTTEPYAYPIPASAIVATASSQLNDDVGPEKTVDGSGLDENERHSAEMKDMWLAGGGAQPAWLQYEFDKAYSLQEIQVWNYNQAIEPIVGFGLKDAVIEYSADGAIWMPIAETTQFARAPGSPGYASNTTVAFDGVAVKSIRITARSSWGGGSQYGLSEIRFYYAPMQAREPQPASGASGVGPEVALSWRPGRKAAAHDVYVSADQQAVQDGTAPMETVTIGAFDAGTLALDTTYYWRVDEVNAAEAPISWTGDIWNFSTPEFLVVDDFEAYTDEEGSRIYEDWIDGWGTANNGSQVGYAGAPFAEQTIVNGGRQSMPLAYDNSTASFSEAKRTFDAPQDWTRAGIRALAIHFRGEPNNTGGRLYVKVNGSKVVYDRDATDIAKSRWTQWNIDLGSLGGNLRNVSGITIGVEAGGSGVLNIEDIRLHASRCVASLRQPGGDLNDDCVVDYLDLEIMANDWLMGDSTLTTASAASVATGLLAHYSLDGNVQDSSGSNLHGTINGNPTHVPGVLGQAMTFDGIGDYVSCTNHVKWDAVTNAITVAAWMRVDVFDVTYQAIATKGDNSWRISRNTETNSVHWRANGPDPALRVNGQVNVNDGEWHHVAGTYDGAAARLYVDGLPDGMVETTGAIAKNTEHVFIGGNSQQAARLWKGAIDDVRIYTRALTEAEVRYLADVTPGDGQLYLPVKSPAELHSAEPMNKRSVNLRDFSRLAETWLDIQLWP